MGYCGLLGLLRLLVHIHYRGVVVSDGQLVITVDKICTSDPRMPHIVTHAVYMYQTYQTANNIYIHHIDIDIGWFKHYSDYFKK